MKQRILGILAGALAFAQIGGCATTTAPETTNPEPPTAVSSNEPRSTSSDVETLESEASPKETASQETTSEPPASASESADEGSTSDDETMLEAYKGVKLEHIDGMVHITFPNEVAQLIGLKREDIESIKEQEGYEEILAHDDGRFTYIMTPDKHEAILVDLKENLDNTMRELPGTENYKAITKIEANDDYSEFTVTTQSEAIDPTEYTISTPLILMSGTYHIFQGEAKDEPRISFVNEASGRVIFDSTKDEAPVSR